MGHGSSQVVELRDLLLYEPFSFFLFSKTRVINARQGHWETQLCCASFQMQGSHGRNWASAKALGSHKSTIGAGGKRFACESQNMLVHLRNMACQSACDYSGEAFPARVVLLAPLTSAVLSSELLLASIRRCKGSYCRRVHQALQTMPQFCSHGICRPRQSCCGKTGRFQVFLFRPLLNSWLASDFRTW